MPKFIAMIGKSNRILSIEAATKDQARAEIDRQLMRNPQRREIRRQWQGDGGYIVSEELRDQISDADAVASVIGSLRGLLAELDLRATPGDNGPEAAPVYYAIERARDALQAYDRRHD